MAGYRDNQWYFTDQEEKLGVTGLGGLAPTGRDNEPFLYPKTSPFQTKLGIASQTNTGGGLLQTKGFIRSLNKISGVTNADRRFFFQFNPPALMRNLVMNTDMLNPLLLTPGELTLPVPGQANFSFEIMLDRQAEVNAGVTEAQRARGLEDLTSDRASAYEIGVLADINVLDKVIGVGVDPEAVDVALKRAQIQYSYQSSDTESGGGATSNISNISTPTQNGEKWEVIVTHSTKDFVVNGNTVSISGCLPVNFNISSAEVSAVSNTTPYTFKISYDSNPGTSCTNFGVATNLTTAETASTDENLWDDVTVRERLTTLGSESNRAFLIPNPVRVVFSSLYMVDGYVTGVNLLFTKFSRNMIPVTATLAIQMEARYIGFARERTFLTDVLEKAREASEEEPTTPPPTTIVNTKFYQLQNAVASLKNDYEILIAGTDNNDNPNKWCTPKTGEYKIKNILSFDTLVVQFGFRSAYTYKDVGFSAEQALQTTDSRYAFIKYVAQGNIKSVTHQVTKARIFRKDMDPSETGTGISDVTLLEVGPIVAPPISSYTDFVKFGALGGSGATKQSDITDVANTKLASLSPGYSGNAAKNIAKNLYFVNAIPNGKTVEDIELFAEVEVESVITDNDGNSITLNGKLTDYKLGNLYSYFHVRPTMSMPQSQVFLPF